MDDLPLAVWRKSSRSGGGGECVEVARLADGARAVRDSKNPTGPTLRFPQRNGPPSPPESTTASSADLPGPRPPATHSAWGRPPG
ncbi:MAG: DUF397 domain-containing protein [Pseudonocardiaceae bacterium]